MSTYAKDAHERPSGFATQETVKQLVEKFDNMLPYERNTESIELGAPAPPQLRRKTYSRAKKQRDTPVKKERDPVAIAQQSKHFEGTFVVDKSKFRTPKHKFPLAPGSTREDRRRMITERRNRAEMSKNPMNALYDYEGLFNGRFHVGTDEETQNWAQNLAQNIMERFKDIANSNKVTFNHIFTMGNEQVNKTIRMLLIVVTGVYLKKFVESNTPQWLKGMMHMVLTLGTMFGCWAFVKEVLTTIAKNGEAREMHRAMDCVKDMSEEQKNEMKEYFASHGVDVEQVFPESSWASITEAFSGLIGASFTALSGFVLPKSWLGKLKFMQAQHRAGQDLKSLVCNILKLLSRAFDAVTGANTSEFFSTTKDLDDWGVRVTDLYDKFKDGTLNDDIASARLVDTLLKEGALLSKKDESLTAGMAYYRNFCMKLLDKMEAHFTSIGFGSNERQVPLIVCLRGSSGVGKSYIARAFIEQVLLKCLPEHERADFAKNPSAHTYLYLPEEGFANGYNGQHCVIVDDMGQFLTQKGQNDDMQQIIRWGNVAPCRMDAAELSRKGKVVFNSPMVFCTTNLYQYYSPSIAIPEAFVRRFDMFIDMVPRKEFCTDATVDKPCKDRRLDKNKLNKILELDACEYRLQRLVNPSQQTFTTERVMTYDECVEEMVRRYKKHEEEHLALLSVLRERRDEMLENATRDVEHDEALMAEADIDGEIQYEGIFAPLRRLFRRPGHIINRGPNLFRGLVRRMRDLFQRGVSHFFNFAARATVKRMLVVLGIAVAFIVCTRILSGFFRRRDNSTLQPKYEAELLENGGTVKLFHNKLMSSILDRNVYHMYMEHDDPERSESAGTVTMVSGTCGAMNWHYIPQFREAFENGHKLIKLVSHSNLKNVKFVPIAHFLDDDNLSVDIRSDLVLVKFDKSFSVCRDIIKHFVRNDTIMQNRDFNTALFCPKAPKCLMIWDVARRAYNKPVKVNGNYHDNLIVYDADTQTGDCGSLLAYTGDYANTQERILGLHMAGFMDGGKKGLSNIVTQEKLRAMMANFGPQPRILADVKVEGDFMKGENLCHVVVRPDEKRFYAPTKSVLCKSKLYGALSTPTKDIARLAPFEQNGAILDPRKLAHVRQDSYNTYIDNDLLTYVINDVYKKLSKFANSGGKKLSFEEAVRGVDGKKYIRGIPRGTSAGDYALDRPDICVGKREIFGEDNDYDFTSPQAKELRAYVEAKLNEMSESIVPEDRVFLDFLKDEKLPSAKVEIGKTRMISACSLPYTIIYRMYYGWVCNDIMEGRIFDEIAVGTNPYSAEWNVLAAVMQSKGKKVIAGDFSGYDNSQSGQLIHAVMEVMSRLTGLTSERDKAIMDVLAVTLAQPYHRSSGFVYELDHGMPSGNPMTSIMNSIFGMIAFRLCWLKCTHDQFISPQLSLKAFNENVQLVMYGDDNLVNVSDDFIGSFNQHTMMENFPAFGLKYTSDNKEDANPPMWRTLEEVSFLKRTFRFDTELGRYVCPLDLSTVDSMLDFTKRGGSGDSITLDNCENAMREWSLHGRKVFERKVQKLVPIVQERMGEELEVLPHKLTLYNAVNYEPEWLMERI